MPKIENISSSFTHEFLLCVNRKEEHILLLRLNCARQLYNACLAESLKRLRVMRNSQEWQITIKMPVKTKKEVSDRNKIFNQLNKKFGFNDFSIQAFATETKNACHIGDHLGAHICQKTAARAFSAVQQYVFKKRGKPRFKGINQLNSLEGKNNDTGIRWINNKLHWKDLELKPFMDFKDKKEIQEHSLSCRVKYVRLVRRVINGKNKFYAQLILEGKPLNPHQIGNDIIGLDLGPSSIACASGKDAFLEPFCKELKTNQKAIRLIQRKIDRSLRAFNPEAYDEKGTVKTGIKLKKSNNCQKLIIKLKEEYRKAKETRKKLHGAMVNKIFSMGNVINFEKISYKAWQKMFGKSVGFRAPGLFISIIKSKAESAGVKFNEILTYDTRLSQICHNCGKIKKKSLNERWHQCECGINAQRDLYSAFLARHVSHDGEKYYLDICQAQQAWPGAEPLLLSAVSRCDQTISGKLRLSSFGLSRRQNSSLIKEEIVQNDVFNISRVNVKNIEVRVLKSFL